MRRLRIFAGLPMLLALMLATSSCNDDWDKWEILTFEAQDSQFGGKDFPMAGGTGTIAITTNGVWKVTSVSDWIEVSETEGIGDATVNYTVKPSNGEVRNGSISLTCDAVGDVAGRQLKVSRNIRQVNNIAENLAITISTTGSRTSQYENNGSCAKVRGCANQISGSSGIGRTASPLLL